MSNKQPSNFSWCILFLVSLSASVCLFTSEFSSRYRPQIGDNVITKGTGVQGRIVDYDSWNSQYRIDYLINGEIRSVYLPDGEFEQKPETN